MQYESGTLILHIYILKTTIKWRQLADLYYWDCYYLVVLMFSTIKTDHNMYGFVDISLDW